MIYKELNEQLKDALRAKDTTRLLVIRDLKSAFTNELVASGKKPGDDVDDETALKVIKQKAKQRKDSIEQFQKAGRNELVETEEAELRILQEYLPAELSDEDIERIVLLKKKELAVTDKKDMGRLMAAAMKEIGAQADGSRVKAVVDSSLS